MADSTMPTNQSPAPASMGDWQAAIAYLSILFLYTAWSKKDSPTHMWHAKNGAGIFVTYLGIYVVVQILWNTMPIGMMAIFNLLMGLVNLAVILVSLYGAWNAWKGKQWTIPVVTSIGQKIPLEKWFRSGTSSTSATPMPTAAPVPSEPVKVPEPMTAPVAPVTSETPSAPITSESPAEPTTPSEPTPPQTPAA